MFTEKQKAWMLEGERRGLLNDEQKAYLAEARSRGLIDTPAEEGGFFDAVKDSPVGGFVRGLRDIPDAGAQMITRGLEAVAPAGSGFEAWAKSEREGVEAINAQAESEYQDDWRKGDMRDELDTGRVVGNIAATLPVAAAAPVASATLGPRVAYSSLAGGSSAAMQPVYNTDNFAEEKAKQVGLGVVAGPVAGEGLRAVGKAVGPTVRKSVQSLMDQGITPTPGQIIGGAAQRAEEGLRSAPILGDMISSAQTKGIKSFNRVVINRALKPIGANLPESVDVGRDAVGLARKAVSNAYDEALDGVQVKMDETFARNVGKIMGMSESLGKTARSRLSREMDDIQTKIIGDGMDAQTYKVIDSKLGKDAANFQGSTDAYQRELGDALSAVRDELRNLMIRNNPRAAAKIKAADLAHAQVSTIERAAASQGAEDGVFTANQLSAAVKAGDKTVRKGRFARGEALMQDLSDEGKDVISQKLPNSGTADRLMVNALGAGGAIALDPTILAGAGALSSIYTTPGQKALAALLTKRPETVTGPIRGLLDASAPFAPIASGALVNQR